MRRLRFFGSVEMDFDWSGLDLVKLALNLDLDWV